VHTGSATPAGAEPLDAGAAPAGVEPPEVTSALRDRVAVVIVVVVAPLLTLAWLMVIIGVLTLLF
jgi:hypothetical protein